MESRISIHAIFSDLMLRVLPGRFFTLRSYAHLKSGLIFSLSLSFFAAADSRVNVEEARDGSRVGSFRIYEAIAMDSALNIKPCPLNPLRNLCSVPQERAILIKTSPIFRAYKRSDAPPSDPLPWPPLRISFLLPLDRRPSPFPSLCRSGPIL